MKYLSNSHNIPLSIAVFLAGDDYDGHSDDPYNISVTTLLKPIRQIVLSRRLPEDSITDISQLIRSRLGQAYHKAIEDSWLDDPHSAMEKLGVPKRVRNRVVINPTGDDLNNPDIIPIFLEIRTEKKVGKWTVTGKFDQVINGTLEDNKSTGVYTYTKQTNADKYVMQGSLYRWLNPSIVTEDHMVINYIFTDWSGGRAKGDKNYPPLPIHWQKYKLKPVSEIDVYIKNKLSKIERHLDLPEEQLPECSDEDLWRKETVYKYYSSPESTRSSKNFTDRFEAESHVMAKGKGHIVTVPGEVVACKYCPAYNLCTQKDRYLATGELKL